MGTARRGGVGPSRPRKAEEVLLRMLSGSHVDPAPTGVSLRQKTAPRQLPPPPAAPSSLRHCEFLGWQMVGGGGLRGPVPSQLSSSAIPTPYLLCPSRSFPG